MSEIVSNLTRSEISGAFSHRDNRAIEIFVVVPHAIEDLRADAGKILQQFISDFRMTPHDRFFIRVKASGLVEN